MLKAIMLMEVPSGRDMMVVEILQVSTSMETHLLILMAITRITKKYSGEEVVMEELLGKYFFKTCLEMEKTLPIIMWMQMNYRMM